MPGYIISSPIAALTLVATASLLMTQPAPAQQAPGGYVVSNTIDKPIAAPPNATQIRGFLPERGAFTFPSPWNSLGVRITNSSDCGGSDCVDNGYNYYEKANNSAGSDTMLIIAGLSNHGGATLFEFNKETHKLTNAGPIFDGRLQHASTEQMSFSLSKPHILYVNDSNYMWAYDVVTHKKTLVYDTNELFDGSNGYGYHGKTLIWSPTVSKDDTMFGAIVENNSPPHHYFRQGCMAYNAKTKKVVAYFKAHTSRGIHSCIIDKSGSYLWMTEWVDNDKVCKDDTGGAVSIIGNIATGEEKVLCDRKPVSGGGGHRAVGWKWLVAADNQGTPDGVQAPKRLWNEAGPIDHSTVFPNGETQGQPVWNGAKWGTHPTGVTSHQSWMHAQPPSVVPLDKQFVCGSNATRKIDDWFGDGINWGYDYPFNGAVVCFKTTTKHQDGWKNIPTLVVAPAMSIEGTEATSGLNDYDIQPKGVMDPTGHWYIFTSDHGTGRRDLFMVKIPCQKLNACPPITISVTSPPPGATVGGAVSVKATTSDTEGIARVQFQLDGADVGPSLDRPPYTIQWDPSSDSPGNHTLTALAFKDTRGYVSSKPVSVSIVTRTKPSPPPSGAGGNTPQGGSGALGLWTFSGLLLLAFSRYAPQRPTQEQPARGSGSSKYSG